MGRPGRGISYHLTCSYVDEVGVVGAQTRPGIGATRGVPDVAADADPSTGMALVTRPGLAGTRSRVGEATDGALERCCSHSPGSAVPSYRRWPMPAWHTRTGQARRLP
jgi:hypothetical protein